MKQEKISFAADATTKEAAAYVLLFSWVIIKNIGKAINRIVHKLPWVFIIITIAASVITSMVCIGQARAERDSYNKKMVHLTQEIDSYKALYGDGKEAKR